MPIENNSQGVSGNRRGNKVYSFNTSIRMPDKNIEFLRILKKYEGKLITDQVRINIYKDAIQSSTLTPVNMNSAIKQKINRGELLSNEEMNQVLLDNRPRNDFTGRVGDYIMALESQALVQRLGNPRKYRIRLTELGNKLLEDNADELDIYTKAMIGLEYGSPARDSVKNKTIPFLNTLFIIKELSKLLKNDNFKGITLYEFGLFVLTMKNCNYSYVCQEIINYRNQFGLNGNEEYIRNYLSDNDIQPYSENTLYDYADEVLRKFKKTGLIVENRVYRTRYINLNKHELVKIDLLLDQYRAYSWKNYSNVDDYFEMIENIVLPWEDSSSNYHKIVKDKAKVINYNLTDDDITRNEYEKINRMYYQYIFENNDYSQFPYENIKNELYLINKTIDGNTTLPDIEEYVRLEWFTSLLFASKFGKDKVKANLILDENGLPLSQAPGNSADIELKSDNIQYNIEVTTIRNRNQQLNAETTTVARHMESDNLDSSKNIKAILVAPYIHKDTIRYYRFESKESNITMLPISIDMMIKIVDKSNNFQEFDNYIEKYCKLLKSTNVEVYEQLVNNFKED